MRVIYQTETMKTRLQWLKENRVINEGEEGILAWTNQFCKIKSHFFDISQTHEASHEEYEKAMKPIRERRNENSRRYYQRKKREKQIEDAAIIRDSEIAKAIILPAVKCNNPSKTICIDVETTGLSYIYDNILQFSAIDGEGNVLLNTLVKPYMKCDWKEAERINGISPDMVSDAPEFHELIPVIQGIFDSAVHIISYNGDFDESFLSENGIQIRDGIRRTDIMIAFARVYGEWNDYYSDYKWQKLITCANYYGYEPEGNFHDSLEDVKATLYCYNKMKERSQMSDEK